jgi:dephospho-CoA kinase
MRVYGLTGGIASGKSTVHRMLVGLGAHVLDADKIYHDLIAPRGGKPSPLALNIEARFPGMLKADGTIDRAKLGARVYANADDRKLLNALTHPHVGAEVAGQVGLLAHQGVELVFYDVPLLYEGGLEKGMEGVAVVWVPRDVQRARLMQRDGIDTATADKKLAAQMSLDDKRARATWVIDNSGTIEGTEQQVRALWETVRALD